MKYILFFVLITLNLYAGILQGKIIALDTENEIAKLNVENVDVGVSGYVVHNITDEHSTILKSCEVIAYDPGTQTATIVLSDFEAFQNDTLPSGKWKLEVGDSVVLASGYNRSLLIAPNEEVYYQLSKAVKTQWVHPDLFATALSVEGHPTPLEEDFKNFTASVGVGVLFIYLEQKVYTLDSNSFKILSITDAPLIQEDVKLPFYSRVEEIEASWFGEGSSELENYEPHYYAMLIKSNVENKIFYEIVKNSKNKEVSSLADQFKIGE